MYLTAATVDKNKQRTGQGIGLQIRTDDAAQAVEGFTHVADAAIQVDAGGGGQSEHRERPLSVSTTVRRVKGSKPLSTSMDSFAPRRTLIPDAVSASLPGIS